MFTVAPQLDCESEDAWHGLLTAQKPDLCELCASAQSPMAARRATQRALDVIELQRP